MMNIPSASAAEVAGGVVTLDVVVDSCVRQRDVDQGVEDAGVSTSRHRDVRHGEVRGTAVYIHCLQHTTIISLEIKNVYA